MYFEYRNIIICFALTLQSFIKLQSEKKKPRIILTQTFLWVSCVMMFIGLSFAGWVYVTP